MRLQKDLGPVVEATVTVEHDRPGSCFGWPDTCEKNAIKLIQGTSYYGTSS